MTEDKYVAAIEISSSKTIAVVGKFRPDGQLDILATEQEKGVDSVRNGVIKNLEVTSLRIQRILRMLEQKPVVAPRKISGLYVGLSGQSLRSIPTRVSLNLPEDTDITDEILQRLKEQALATAIDSSLEVVDAVPRSYKLGNTETLHPKGETSNNISACYDLIVCRPELSRNLKRTLQDKLHLDIKGVVVTALATGQLILSPDEKRLGCMLVDMGGETTTVSIYKNGHLQYFATLPIGGRNITRDLTCLSILEERAEDLKISNGNAIPHGVISTINHNGIRDVDVSNLIVARSEEIVINILKQINYAEMEDSDIPGGIIVIGGGAKLNGMLELLDNKSGLHVRRGQLPNYIKVQDNKISSYDIIEVASVLYAGASGNPQDCLELPQREDLPVTGTANEPDSVIEKEDETVKEPKPSKSTIWTKIGRGISNIFVGGPEEDDSDPLD